MASYGNWAQLHILSVRISLPTQCKKSAGCFSASPVWFKCFLSSSIGKHSSSQNLSFIKLRCLVTKNTTQWSTRLVSYLTKNPGVPQGSSTQCLHGISAKLYLLCCVFISMFNIHGALVRISFWPICRRKFIKGLILLFDKWQVDRKDFWCIRFCVPRGREICVPRGREIGESLKKLLVALH